MATARIIPDVEVTVVKPGVEVTMTSLAAQNLLDLFYAHVSADDLQKSELWDLYKALRGVCSPVGGGRWDGWVDYVRED